jgi:polar amino acid transport system substrate-binding protein
MCAAICRGIVGSVIERRASMAIALLAALTCGACAPDERRATPSAPSATLRWGGDAEGGAPFVEADAADPAVVRGFDVDIATLLAGDLGRSPAFTQVAWASIEQSVGRGDVDLGMSGLEDRPELRARYAVTLPYFAFREVLAVRTADSARFRTLDDLRGRRVGTLGATMAYRILRDAERTQKLIPVSYDDDVHPYTDLVDGRVDAVLLDHVIAERALRRIPSGFVIQPATIATGGYVAVLAPGQAALRDSIDRILRTRMADGSLERIFRTWGVWDSTQVVHQAQILKAPITSTEPETVRATAAPWTAYLPALLRGALITLAISIAAMGLAVALGTGIAAGRVYGSAPVRWLLTGYVEVMRGTPVLLQLFVLYYGLSAVIRLPALLAAILGLGLNYAAYESEIYRSALQAVSRTQLEAARTLGLNEWQIFRLVRGPQAMRVALAPMTNDFVALLKDSSLVSVITVVELTKQTAIYATNVGSWLIPGVLCALLYLALSLPLSHMARRIEARWGTP